MTKLTDGELILTKAALVAARQKRREAWAKQDREAERRRDAEAAKGGRWSPLRRLAASRMLGKNKDDVGGNARLLAAGERYRSHWELSQIAPIAACDPSEPHSGAPSSNMSAARLQGAAQTTFHKLEYQDASRAVGGSYFGAVVDAVVLNDETPEEVGLRVSGYKDRGKAIAVAMDRLREGLARLARHFAGIREKSEFDIMRTRSQSRAHESKPRPDEAAPRALATHRPLAGMS